jgi:acylphosphatase
MPRLRLVISGRVQGVGFRWFAREQARELQLRGWVRNRPDGSVEVEAEGDTGSIARLVDRLRIGPPGANVAAIRELDASGEPMPAPFTIQRQRTE